MTLIALCGLMPETPWSEAEREARTLTKGIMDYVKKHLGKEYAPNSRERFRRQVLHQFVEARIADYNPLEPTLPTNSPNTHYAITAVALDAVRVFGTAKWDSAVSKFRREQKPQQEDYERQRRHRMVPVLLPDGHVLDLSPGKHNEVQKAIVEEFAPRFAPGSRLLYLGDTAKKNLLMDDKGLAALGIPINEHDKLPDVVLYDERQKWVILIEAVTSHGPMSQKRVTELEVMLGECTVGIVHVSAFPDFTEFKKHMTTIAWETEVWLADTPDHMIHFNGDRFMGPREEK